MIGDLQLRGIPKALLADMKAAVPFYLDLLLPGEQYNEVKRNLSIEIEYMKAPPEDEGAAGWTIPLDEETFIIQIYSDFIECSPLQTLAHEIVHVKQYALGELRERVTKDKSSSIIWKSKRWNPPEGSHEYWDCPWEIEAFGREYGLYKRFIESRKK